MNPLDSWFVLTQEEFDREVARYVADSAGHDEKLGVVYLCSLRLAAYGWSTPALHALEIEALARINKTPAPKR